ncbi:hypothetical protein YC2023_028090 [Brassica napus]
MKKIDNRSTEPRPWPKSQATTGEKNFIKSHILIMGKAIRHRKILLYYTCDGWFAGCTM